MNKAREQPIIVVRKKVHGHGHHGGAWKVAFADFMTAMFAMFLVLWLVNQSSDVKSAIAGYFQDPLGRAKEYGSSILPGEGAQTQSPRIMSPSQVIDLRRDRLQRLAEAIRQEIRETPALEDIAEHVEIEVTDEGLRIQLLEDSTGVFFESGSAVPRSAGGTLLRLLGRKLGSLPQAVVVEGHTDARPYSRRDGYSNWELSVDRANAARRLLEDGGLSDAQIQQVRGWADRHLRNPDDPFADANRRVTVTMLLPPVLPSDSLLPPPDSAVAGAEVPATPDDQAASGPPAQVPADAEDLHARAVAP